MRTSASSERSRVRRLPARATYHRPTIDAILDESLVAHLAFTVEGQPYVIRTLCARVGDGVYVHGRRLVNALAESRVGDRHFRAIGLTHRGGDRAPDVDAGVNLVRISVT